ncbi:MAG TPA: VanZ family protein [Bryobacteraceae bacterium]|nr:VanZ family protein [Bryobacteraceae bacterium]
MTPGRIHRQWFIVWIVDLALVTVVLLAPGPVIARAAPPASDQAGHLLAYCTLAVFAMLAFRQTRAALAVAVAMLVHGVVMEFLQAVVAIERSLEVADMGFDSVGVLCGMAAGFALRPRLRATPES